MIGSVSNPRVKEVQKLHKSSKYRSQRGLFVAEGWRMFSEIPSDYFQAIYVLEGDVHRQAILDLKKSVSVEVVSDQVLKAMSNETSPQGVLALVKMKSGDNAVLSVDKPLIIALDCVQDPGNLGTIIRTAEAGGVDQVILSKGTVDLYNPKVVKSTMGAIFRMNILREVDLAQVLMELKARKVSIYAAHLKGSVNHFEGDYLGGTCFLMGNEGNGLRDEMADLATTYIRIPMASTAESLNVGIATGVLIYEAVRQRLISG